jgi:hypothetical protein
MATIQVKCVPCRFDENGDADLKTHERITRGRRNVPTLLPDGKPAVLPDGTPDVKQVEIVHVYFQQDGTHPFHLEMTSEQAAAFEIGKDYTLTVGATA